MIDPETLLQGTEGEAMASLDVLRSPKESWSVEVMPRAAGGTQAIVRHRMDGWGLWITTDAATNSKSVFRRVRYALSREGLFDAP